MTRIVKQNYSHMMVIAVTILTLLLCVTVSASALTVPSVTVDSTCLTVKDKAKAIVIGSVSMAKGQKVVVYQFKCWKCVNKPAYKKLQKGDVLVKSDHVAMYIGGGKMAEASGGTWSAGSIAVKKMSKSRYNGFSYVMRYTGY